jgi:UTP--glucose-1-phosphate uridylyltransferase
MKDIKYAIIPCAGEGTRMQPLSLFYPKEMVPIGKYPILHFSIMEAAGIGCDTIVLILSRGKEIIRQYTQWLQSLDEFKHLSFSFFYQEKPTGISDALLLAEDLVGENPFAVLYPDDIFLPLDIPSPLALLKEGYKKSGESIIAMEHFPEPEKILPYGNIKGKWVDEEETLFRISEIIEKPPIELVTTPWATTGRYILLPDMFSYFRALIEDSSGKERYATDALTQYAQEKPLYSVPLNGITRHDAGNIKHYPDTFTGYVESTRRSC